MNPRSIVPILLSVLGGPLSAGIVLGMSPAQDDTRADGGQSRPGSLYYYNGKTRVELRETGQAVARVRPGVAPASIAARPEAAPAALRSMGHVASSLERQRLVPVRTTGRDAMSLKPEERPASVEYVLPILSEVGRRDPPGAAPAAADAGLILTPQISARFSDEFFAGASSVQARHDRVSAYVAGFGLKVATPADRPLRVPNSFALTLADGQVTATAILDAANRLFQQGSASGQVVFAKPNFLRPKRLFQAPPQDPRFPGQWHLNNTGQQGIGGVAGADIKAIPAWTLTEGVPSIRIAIIDDSIQRNHPDLAPNYQAGRHYDAATNGFDDDPSPRNGDQSHGTACAGVAVAAANTVGVRGSAPRCGLIGVHIWDSNFDLQTADAFYFAADPDGDPLTDDGAAVISCSWSLSLGIEVPIEVSTAIDDVARNGRNGRGAVVLFAAGNEGSDIARNQLLGTRDSVICVGASNFLDHRSNYSNYGPELSVVAPSNDNFPFFEDPGVPGDALALAIDTTDNTDDQPRLPNGDRSGYAVGDYTGTGQDGFGGTSSATPLAAGVCGLVLSLNPALTASQVRSIVEHTSDRVLGFEFFHELNAAYDPASGQSLYYGFGRVNAARAVECAQSSRTSPGLVWPGRVRDLAATQPSPDQVRVSWRNPEGDIAGVLVVRSDEPVAWRPYDGERYLPGDLVDARGTRVVSVDRRDRLDQQASPGGPAHFAVFPYSRDHQYAWGRTVAAGAPVPPPPTP